MLTDLCTILERFWVDFKESFKRFTKNEGDLGKILVRLYEESAKMLGRRRGLRPSL